jgi:hypothetical protein
MRAFTMMTLCALAVLATGWTHAANPAPQCTFNDHWGRKTLSTKLYTRFCGPAEAVVYVRGAPVHIRGGFCRRNKGLASISVGLLAFPSAAPRNGIAFEFAPPTIRPGTFSVDDEGERRGKTYVPAQIQAGGIRVGRPASLSDRRRLQVQSGTLTVRASMRSGTCAIFTSNSMRIAGSWTCA